jgi:hypothetical protein
LHLDDDRENRLLLDEEDHEIGPILGGDDVREVRGL